MASNTTSTTTIALVLLVNILFFTLSNACGSCTNPKPTPTPTPTYPTPSTSPGKCPVDTLKFGVCANVLNGLVNANLGKPPKTPCCSLLSGLADAEIAVCLCTAIKANILGINLDIPLDLTLLVNYCGKKVPSGFVCK